MSTYSIYRGKRVFWGELSIVNRKWSVSSINHSPLTIYKPAGKQGRGVQVYTERQRSDIVWYISWKRGLKIVKTTGKQLWVILWCLSNLAWLCA